ncbi:MAG: CHRD domain-containing protein [Saprospiraceae bacterium]
MAAWYNLSDFVSGNRIRTTLKDLTPDDVSKFLSGAYYINVHTAANPGGEIRGQVLLETDFRYSAMLSGDQEVPAVATNAFGIGVFNLSKSGYKLQIKESMASKYFHQCSTFPQCSFWGNGGVVEDLGPFINGNVITATVDPTAYLDELWAGNIYITVHTTDNPGGEIRPGDVGRWPLF